MTIQKDDLEYVIHQSLPDLSKGRRHHPMTVRSIINRLARKKASKLTDKERTFLADFSAAEDQGAFIEDTFMSAAIDAGKTVRTRSFEVGGEPGGWFGISRFFGLYVINYTQYGEGQDDIGPFGTRKEADAAFADVVALNMPF